METATTSITSIVESVEEQIGDFMNIRNEAEKALASIDYDPVAYNEAWNSYAAVSVGLSQMKMLSRFLMAGDATGAENFIRLTIYKIELSTSADDLKRREPSDDEMVNSKLVVYKLFKRYLRTIEK